MTVTRHFFLLVDRLLPKMKKVSLDKEDLNSFRPITNLAFESNVIERIAACQVPHHYLVSNNLYPKLQPAFQQSDNTETASYGYIMILSGRYEPNKLTSLPTCGFTAQLVEHRTGIAEVTDPNPVEALIFSGFFLPIGLNWKMTTLHFDIVKATDNKSDVILVLLDLSAVFDTIDHDFLVTLTTNSVWLYGHSSSVVRVVHPESLSEGSNWLHGIPQGSVLGPPLFILYIAPLENVIDSHELDCMICADDSQLHIIVNSDRRHKAFAKHCISDLFGHFS